MLPLFPRVMVEKKENKNTHFWCCCVWLRDVVEHARVCASTVDRSKQHFLLREAPRSQREALAECWRGQCEALLEAAGSLWLCAGISAEL